MLERVHRNGRSNLPRTTQEEGCGGELPPGVSTMVKVRSKLCGQIISGKFLPQQGQVLEYLSPVMDEGKITE